MARAMSKVGIAWALVAAVTFAPACTTGRRTPLNYWETAGSGGATVARDPAFSVKAYEAEDRTWGDPAVPRSSERQWEESSTWEVVGGITVGIIVVVVYAAVIAVCLLGAFTR